MNEDKEKIKEMRAKLSPNKLPPSEKAMATNIATSMAAELLIRTKAAGEISRQLHLNYNKQGQSRYHNL